MAKKILKADLSVSSINDLKKQLQDYQKELIVECREFVEELAKVGINVAEAKIGESPLGKYISVKTNITEEQAGCKAILVAAGETFEHEGYSPFNSLLAIEFGAGIYYNPIPNPNADKFGMGVGTFPGQIHAHDPNGWWFWDENKQEWVHSYGVKATMPMYHASVEIQQNIVATAKKVFK